MQYRRCGAFSRTTGIRAKKTGHASKQDRPDILSAREAWFEAWVAGALAPTLKRGDVVILNNLPAHKSVAAREGIEARGARLIFLPPCSPDFNPIENAFARLKALLPKTAARTAYDLSRAIGAAIDSSTPAECANYFAATGYDAH